MIYLSGVMMPVDTLVSKLYFENSSDSILDLNNSVSSEDGFGKSESLLNSYNGRSSIILLKLNTYITTYFFKPFTLFLF